MIKFRIATKKDNQALCELEHNCPQGTDFKFYFEREIFLKKGQLYKKFRTMLAEDNGKIIAVESVAIKRVWIAGERKQIGYFYDLRVHPNYRGQWLAQKLQKRLINWLSNKNVKIAYTYVLASESISNRICERAGMKLAGSYSVFYIPVKNFKAIYLDDIDLGGINAKASIKKFNGFAKYYNLTPDNLTSKKLAPYWYHFYMNNVAISVWDGREIIIPRIVSVPFKYRMLNQLGKIKSFNLPYIPKPGELFHTLTLASFTPPDASWEKFKINMEFVNKLASLKGIDMLVVYQDKRSILYEDLKQLALVVLEGNIYFAGENIDIILEKAKDFHWYIDPRDI